MKVAISDKIRGLLSLLVAVAAVLLSQFPPVYQWVASANLQIKITHFFVLSSDIFRAPSINKNYSVTNVGRAPGRVKSLHLFITNSSDEILYETSAQAYRLRSLGQFDGQKWEEFAEISLSPGRNWSHVVSFGRYLSSTALNDIHDVRWEVGEEREVWREEMESRGHDVDSLNYEGPSFDISKGLSEKLSSMVKQKIPWFQEGDYRLYEISLTSDRTKVMAYEFAIRKRHIRQFFESLDRRLDAIDYGDAPYVQIRIHPSTERMPKSIMERVRDVETLSYY